MKMKRPASWHRENSREGTPLGNGLHGALMYGSVGKEKIMLTHTTLWREGQPSPMPDVSDVLPKMRAKILAGDIAGADPMILDALRERGYAPREAFPFPAADIHIHLPVKDCFSHYSRTLNMNRAEGTVTYRDGQELVTRKGFVSRADDVVVISCHKDSEVDISIHHPEFGGWGQLELPENVEVRREGEWIYFKAEISGVEHGAVLRVVKGAETLILARLYTQGQSAEQWPLQKAYLEKLPPCYDTLLSRHEPIHRALFEACTFTLEGPGGELTNEELLDQAFDGGLPNALTQRCYAYGRYLLICGTQKGGLPCNLTGLWSGEYRAFWAFNMANINLEMIYWQALPGGLTELMMPVFDYYDSGMDEFRENARKMYGCKGIFLPAVTSPGCMRHVCMAPHITNWTAGAGWIAQHYYDYYLYTGDKDFLTRRALPFMREAAAFYQDFLVWEGDGWHIYPSVSPENRTLHYRDGSVSLSEGTQTSIDASMDVAVVKELFSNLLAAGEITGLLTEEEKASYQKILKGAPAYTFNQWGAPREWLHPDFEDNDFHRHHSHLYPVFPGLELARSDENTMEAYHQGALRRVTTGLAHQTSWSLIQNACTMARVKDGENALRSLSIISKTCMMRNLFTTHNDWRDSGVTLEMAQAPYQIDACIGWSSAVQEMLLYSDPQRMDLLPALPKAWEKGGIGPLHTRCGAQVTLRWEKQGGQAEILAPRGARFTLYLPDNTRREMILAPNEKQTVSFSIL